MNRIRFFRGTSPGIMTASASLIVCAGLAAACFFAGGKTVDPFIMLAAELGTKQLCTDNRTASQTLSSVQYDIPQKMLPGFFGKLEPQKSFSELRISEAEEAEGAKSLMLMPEPNLPGHYEIPSDYLPVISADLAYRGMELINDTDFKISDSVLRGYSNPFVKNDEETGPVVLVIHTHATEAFYEDDPVAALLPHDALLSGYYKVGSYAPRSSDITKNVVAVGDVFVSELEAMGINTLHDRTLHDYNNYEGAYTSSQNAIKEYMKKYPSIKYVIDIHRDSLIKNNGEKLNPVTSISGAPTAQVMCVVGTNQSGYYHPNWKLNLQLAYKFRETLNAVDESLCRPIYLRTGRFNQHLSPGSMLLEIGSCGSRLEEAKNAAVLAARALGSIILE